MLAQTHACLAALSVDVSAQHCILASMLPLCDMFPELRDALTVSYATHLTRLADGHGAEPRVESNIFPPDLGPDIVQTRHCLAKRCLDAC